MDNAIFVGTVPNITFIHTYMYSLRTSCSKIHDVFFNSQTVSYTCIIHTYTLRLIMKDQLNV